MNPKIKDLSGISAEDLKFRNTKFLTSDAQYDMLEHQSRKRLRHRIWVVRNGDLRRVFKDFPFEDSLSEQCAGWMQAVAGKHFFPDANHRTAIALLRKILRDNGITPRRWPPKISEKAVIRSHRVRKEMENIRLDNLYDRDRLFLVWLIYFKSVLKKPVY